MLSTHGCLDGPGGGAMPIWSKDGSQLFYRHGDLMMAVAVMLEPELDVSTPQALFELAIDAKTIGWATPYYDVAADGRFLAVSDRSTTEFKLITNWFEELKQRVPTGRYLRLSFAKPLGVEYSTSGMLVSCLG